MRHAHYHYDGVAWRANTLPERCSLTICSRCPRRRERRARRRKSHVERQNRCRHNAGYVASRRHAVDVKPKTQRCRVTLPCYERPPKPRRTFQRAAMICYYCLQKCVTLMGAAGCISVGVLARRLLFPAETVRHTEQPRRRERFPRR